MVPLERYDPKFYDTLCEWWKAHDGVAAPAEDLASGLGAVAFCRHQLNPKGAGFLFVAGRIGIIEAFVLKPGLGVQEARDIADTLHRYLRSEARRKGVTKLIAFVQSKGMVRECKRVGFQQVGSPLAQMVQTL